MEPVLNLYPVPTPGATAVGTFPGFNGWYYSDKPLVVNEDYILGRLDYTIGPKDTFFARYVHDGANEHQPYPASTLPYWPETDKSGNHISRWKSGERFRATWSTRRGSVSCGPTKTR